MITGKSTNLYMATTNTPLVAASPNTPVIAQPQTPVLVQGENGPVVIMIPGSLPHFAGKMLFPASLYWHCVIILIVA